MTFLRFLILGLACMAMPAMAAADQCAAPALMPDVDAASFAEAGFPVDAERVETLKKRIMANLDQAFVAVCAAGTVKPDLFSGHKRLIIQDGEGATEPLFYIDDEQTPPRLIFQYAFQNGPPPAVPAIEFALKCWANPDNEDCFSD